MKIKSRLLREEDGIGIVWFAMSFVIIVFVVGMVIDAGRLFMTKSQLQKAADAAALSGCQQITQDTTMIENTVYQILEAHNELSSLKLPSYLKIKPSDNLLSVGVTLEKDVPLYFMGLFGFNSTPVMVKSVAEADPLVRTTGVVPLGIDKDMIPDVKNGPVEVTLKVDSGDVEYGNFGIVALAGVGGKVYEDTLKYGYEDYIEEGTIFDTQTGNVTQKTVSAVSYRIDSSPYTEGDMSHPDDPRILTILVYTPVTILNGNQLKSIKVTGLAYFYLDEPMSSTDSTIHGKFISLAGKGFGDKDATDYGAYAVKLVK